MYLGIAVVWNNLMYWKKHFLILETAWRLLPWKLKW